MPVSRESIVKALQEVRNSGGKRNFTQSIDLIVKLKDVDMRKPESRILETVELPNPPQKPVKVCVIAGGELAIKAREVGADLVIGREDLERLGTGKKAARKLADEYEFFIAEAPLMPLVGRTLGAVLGPRGKMPTPTPPTADIDTVIKSHRRMVRIRARDQPLVQCKVGTEDMLDEKIVENIQAVLSKLEAKLEHGARNIDAITLKTTMGPAVRVQI